jgi:hypothetical protein
MVENSRIPIIDLPKDIVGVICIPEGKKERGIVSIEETCVTCPIADCWAFRTTSSLGKIMTRVANPQLKNAKRIAIK